MSNSEIEPTMRAFLSRNFFLDPGVTLGGQDSLLESGIVDSTGMLEIIQFLEEQFGISVDDLEVLPENLDSVVNLIQYVGRKRAAGGQAA